MRYIENACGFYICFTMCFSCIFLLCHDLQLDEEDFNEEQNSVACLMHMLYNDDPDEMLKVAHLLL